VASELRESPSPETRPDRHRRRGRCARTVTVLAVFGVATAAAVAWGCGAESAGNAFATGNLDASLDAGEAGSDVSHPPDGPDGGVPPTAIFVNAAASPTVSDVRLCWQVGDAMAPVVPFPGSGAMPGSNYPGIPLGGAASLDDVSALTGGEVTFYAIDAENLARVEQGASAPDNCAALICGAGANLPTPCLRQGTDYWPVDPLPSFETSGHTGVVALTGCLATALDSTASVARCGPTWDDVNGNLHVEVTYLQPAPPIVAGQLAVEVALLSPALTGARGDAGVVVWFGDEEGGAPVATLTYEDDVEPNAAPATLFFGTSLPAFGSMGFGVDAPGVANGGGHEWMSLVQAQQLVDPTQDPTIFFGQPRTYLVAVLGDPGSTHAFSSGEAAYDGTGLHLLVIAAPAPATETPDAQAD
jgi:hypothetical protein